VDRRRFLVTSLASALTAPLSAGAQQAAKVYRIGYLDLLEPHDLFEALREGLRELGYVEGRTILIEQRWAQGKAEQPGVWPQSSPDLSWTPLLHRFR
jgi:putative ABC transport system substrate-binding protein